MSNDKIVYIITSAGGGQDGLDHTDKGGRMLSAFFDREPAEKKIGHDSRYILTPTVIDVVKARQTAIAKLDPLDRLILGLGK